MNQFNQPVIAIYRSKLLPGITFNSYEEARKAEEDLKNKKNESAATESIDRYNKMAPSMSMASRSGSDAWINAPIDQLQQIGEGQVLNEMYGGPMGVARDLGITSNPSSTAKEFTSNLSKEKETKPEGQDLKWKAQMEKDTPESKQRAIELSKVVEETGQYPDLNFDIIREAIKTNYNGAYQFIDKLSKGQLATGEGIRRDYQEISPAVNKAVSVGTAELPIAQKRQYLTTTASEEAKRDIQKTYPMLSGANSTAVSQAAIAVKNLFRLRDQLENGNVDYFDVIKKTGQFKNPNVNNAYQQVSEIVGRQQSGAAISNTEWSQFGKEILNKNFLLTEQGQKTALENINDYIDRFFSVGTLITSDDNWYDTYNARSKKQREGNETLEPVIGLTGDKKKRLEELRAKKQAGTLGK